MGRDCVSKFELSKIFDSNVTDEEAQELRLAEAKVKRFLQWDLSFETVDVALQIREMLDAATLEFEDTAEDVPDVQEEKVIRHQDEDENDEVEVVEIEDSVSGDEDQRSEVSGFGSLLDGMGSNHD